MDKNNYRRRTNTQTKRNTTRTNRFEQEVNEEEKSFQETIINQMVTSGIIVAGVLIVSLVNTDITKGIKLQLKELLGKSSTVEEVRESGGMIRDKYKDALSSVQVIFGNEEKQKKEKNNIINEANSQIEDIGNEQENLLDDDVIRKRDRVDLDVLEELEIEGGPSNEKKPIVPE